jgi:TonB family protein
MSSDSDPHHASGAALAKRKWGNAMSTFDNPINSYDSLFMSVQIPRNKSRWEVFVVSYLVQALVLAALLMAGIFAPKLAPPLESLASHVELVAPYLSSTPPAHLAKPAVREFTKIQTATIQPAIVQPVVAALPAKIEAPVPQVLRPQRVQLITPVAEIAQPQAVPVPKYDSKLLAALPGPKVTAKIVATNTFGGSSAAPTLQKVAPSKVQTGGFGDPNGVAPNANGSNHSNIAAGGSFDLPQGAGYGNGTGGASGVRGTVASAGFGSGVALQGGGGRGGNAAQGRVQTTTFATAPSAEEPHQNRAVKPALVSVPVSIQSKPTPVYTSEARQLRVEGEVLLNVVFAADGQVRILNVVRGLGHGLDEAAQRAAQGVRFTPASRDGHPVDSNATLHIVFQLS